MSEELNPSKRCGIVLAGGEGKRLQPFIHRLKGEMIPKQYINFTGRRSMLEHTFDRIEKLIPPNRLFTIVSRDHLQMSDVRKRIVRNTPRFSTG